MREYGWYKARRKDAYELIRKCPRTAGNLHLLYSLLASEAGHDEEKEDYGLVDTTIGKLCEITGYTRKQVRSYLEKLAEIGWIETATRQLRFRSGTRNVGVRIVILSYDSRHGKGPTLRADPKPVLRLYAPGG